MKLELARVLRHEQISSRYRVLGLLAPSIAQEALPGQFVHVQVPGRDGPTLRRPFSIYKAEEGELSILYKLVGRGTEAISGLVPEDNISLMGPLGNSFPSCPPRRFPVLVAGGYGVAPLSFLAERLETKGIAFIGASTAADILCTEDFRRLGWPVRVATEDGTLGLRGLVTAALGAWLSDREQAARPELYACGPDSMLEAVKELASAAGAKAWLSLDKHMGCGVGACLACVQRAVRPDGKTEWVRVCRDGPVFDSEKIVWK
ncbi:dihydroorotate dehydrogenase electron transfer subunit [Verrucomicrobiota bacterium]